MIKIKRGQKSLQIFSWCSHLVKATLLVSSCPGVMVTWGYGWGVWLQCTNDSSGFYTQEADRCSSPWVLRKPTPGVKTLRECMISKFHIPVWERLNSIAENRPFTVWSNLFFLAYFSFFPYLSNLPFPPTLTTAREKHSVFFSTSRLLHMQSLSSLYVKCLLSPFIVFDHLENIDLFS